MIGSGGPFGAEGPIIMTGGAIGSLIAQYFHLSRGERKTLLVAGAAAGMTAVFGTPIAAVLLAVELLLFELRPRSLLPVAWPARSPALRAPLLMGSGPLFPLQTLPTGPLGLAALASLAGLISGALSWALSSGALQGGRPVRPTADPLDVVAGAGRPCSRHRRLFPAARAGRRL